MQPCVNKVASVELQRPGVRGRPASGMLGLTLLGTSREKTSSAGHLWAPLQQITVESNKITPGPVTQKRASAMLALSAWLKLTNIDQSLKFKGFHG